MAIPQEQYQVTIPMPTLKATIERLWAEILLEDTPVSHEATQVVSIEDLRVLSNPGVDVTRITSGLSPADTTILITFATKLSYDLWQYVLLPRIRQRWGDESLKKVNAPEDRAMEMPGVPWKVATLA